MKNRSFDWAVGGFLIGYQALLLLALPFYFMYSIPSWTLVVTTIVLFFVIGISVTGGYHRYFSHRTYKTNPMVEWVLLFFSAMSIQSSALRWSHDHRLHHAHVDTDDDPYSINKGFWYAHFYWMLQKPEPIDTKIVSDLVKNPRVMFQHRFIVLFMFGGNALLWLVLGWIFNDYLGAFFVGICLRIFVLHHLTWFINSLAHTWGDRPFCQEQTAVNNFVLSILTFGEGYHNYHHVFAKDYRNGVRWYHFDPTKWTIWTLSKLGLAHDLRQMDELVIKQRMVHERKSLLLDRLKELCSDKKDEMEKKVQEMSAKLDETIASCKSMYDNLQKLKKQAQDAAMISKINQEIRLLHLSLKQDWKKWRQLSKSIFRLKTFHPS